MPKYHPNTRFTDCWASVGNITFYHRDGQCYYRTKANPVFPATSHQLVQVSIHKRALQAWRNISHEEQLEWNALATQVKSKRPPYDHKTSISGYNLFVSAYHGYASIGDEKIPEPKPMPDFPTLSLKLISSTVVGTTLQVKFKIENLHASLQNFIIASRIQLVNLGAGTNPGKMRNHQAELTDNIATFTIPLPNQDHNSYTLHMRYFIIDRTTGYRSMQTRQSEDIRLYNS
jgi:hypothetical protein